MLLNTKPSHPTDTRPALPSGQLQWWVILTFMLILTGCGSQSTPTSPDNPDPNTQGQSTESPKETYLRHQRPAPENTDVRAFMDEFWNEVARSDRCGSCHDDRYAPRFVRTDDINLAFTESLQWVDRDQPGQSALIEKAAAGHGCWLGATHATHCASILTRWIENWQQASTGITPPLITLEPPPDYPLPAVRVLPDTAPLSFGLGENNLRSLLKTNCAQCHDETAADPQPPYLASDSLENAWLAIRPRLQVEDRTRTIEDARSRLLVRLREDGHHCWSDCPADAELMLTQIQRIMDDISLTDLSTVLKTSHGIELFDGTVATRGGRYESSVIALWDFSEGDGRQARDISGVAPAMDLILNEGIAWLQDESGIEISPGGLAQANSQASRKLYEHIQISGQYSVEAWLTTAESTTTDGWIVSYSGNQRERNLTLAQDESSWIFFNRSQTTDINGEPSLSADVQPSSSPVHITLTYDAARGRQIYVNGSSLSTWDASYSLLIGNEAGLSRPWAGQLHLLAIHDAALTPDQITTNYSAGIGEKHYLSFQISDLLGLEDCWKSYVVFEARRPDSYSYQFSNPFFARLYSPEPAELGQSVACSFPTAPTEQPYRFRLADIRLGINGNLAPIGQAFTHIDLNIDSELNQGVYQQIDTQGTVIEAQEGPDEDVFFLAFGHIHGQESVFPEPVSITPEKNLPFTLPNSWGTGTFAGINATLAHITGISSQAPTVKTVYDALRTQLPHEATPGAFRTTHLAALTRLATAYCDTLVTEEVARPLEARLTFKDFDFTVSPDLAFATEEARLLIYTPLITMLGTRFSRQPSATELQNDFDTLLDGYSAGTDTSLHRPGLLSCGRRCPEDYTATVVTAVCSAALGSLTLMIQ
jgi:hypothetical protein